MQMQMQRVAMAGRKFFNGLSFLFSNKQAYKETHGDNAIIILLVALYRMAEGYFFVAVCDDCECFLTCMVYK